MLTIEKNDKIVVTGGTGFLGKVLVNTLKERGYTNVVGFGRKYNLVDLGMTRHMYMDHSPTVVIHLAAKVGGIGANQKNPGLDRDWETQQH